MRHLTFWLDYKKVRYTNMTLCLATFDISIRGFGSKMNFLKFLLSLNSQKGLEYKENTTKYRSLSWKPQSHVRILIYRTWPISICFAGMVARWHLARATSSNIDKRSNVLVDKRFSFSRPAVILVLVVREAWPGSVTPDRNFPLRVSQTCMHTTICIKATFIATSLLLLNTSGILPKVCQQSHLKRSCVNSGVIPEVKISQVVATDRSCAWLSTSPKDKE